MSGVSLVAMGDNSSWCFKLHDGTVRHSNLPHRLRDVLEENEDLDMDCIALGPRSSWFVSYTDGTQECGGSISHAGRTAFSRCASYVTLGNNGSFYVRYPDGSYSYHNLPDELETLIDEANWRGASVEFLSLGWQRCEYFVRFDDGGDTELSCRCELIKDDIVENVADITMLVFGVNGNYYVQGEELSSCARKELWCAPPGLREAVRQAQGIILVDPADVRFLHDSISWRFRNYSFSGETIYKLAADIAEGEVDASDIPRIRVVQITCRGGDTEWWGLDHRRLWAFKAAGVTSVEAELVHDIPASFFHQRQVALASPGRGFSITVRTQSRVR